MSEGTHGLDVNAMWEVYASSAIPAHIIELKTDRIIRYNAALAHLTGYDHSELPDIKTWFDKLYPNAKYRQQRKSYFTQSLGSDRPMHEHEAMITCKDGAIRYVEFYVNQMLFDGEQPTYLFISAVDSANRVHIMRQLIELNLQLDRRIQERSKLLEENEKRLMMALEGANEGIWEINFVEGEMQFSPYSAEMLGYTVEELGRTSERWDLLNHPDDWPRVKKALNDHFKGKTDYYEAEYRVRAKNGGWVWILGHGRVTERDAEGRPLKAIGTHVNIEKLKQTEIKLRTSETMFRSLVEAAPFGLVMADRQGQATYVNPEFTDATGYDVLDMTPATRWLVQAFPCKEDRRGVLQFLRSVLELRNDRDVVRTQLEVTCKRGRKRLLAVHGAMLSDSHILFACDDVTEKVRAMEELQRSEAELKLKTEHLEEMNTALRVLLNQRETDKVEMEDRILANIKNLVLPYLDQLGATLKTDLQRNYLSILSANLNEIVSPFTQRLSAKYMHFTPREIQVADLIRDGRGTKDIAEILMVSESSIVFHRHNIRRKLGIVERKVNLRSYLKSLV